MKLDSNNHSVFKMYFHLVLVTKFINGYKSATSRKVKELYPSVLEKLWGSQFWSRSFCLITTGGAPIETIKAYIESQGENHD